MISKTLYMRGILLTFLGLVSSPVLSMQSNLSSLRLPKNVVFQVGGFNAYQGESQQVDIAGLIGDRFTVTQHNDQNALIGLGYFVDGYDTPYARIQFGINAFYLFQTYVKGKVIQEDMFTNLSYHYAVNHFPIYFASRALIDSSSFYTYTADLGLGINFVQSHNFREHSLDGGITIPDDAYSSHTTTQFSATAGIGVRFNNLINCMALEVGYRFFYLGEGNLSKTTPQILNNLKTGNSYVNAIVLTLS